jgi:hypothetical protein
MRVEYSKLFHLSGDPWLNAPVENADVGGGVRIERLEPAWLAEVKRQCQRIGCREVLEAVPQYTHRLYSVAHNSQRATGTEADWQPVLRAIVLSRIVKPTAVAQWSNELISVYRDGQLPVHTADFVVGGLSAAFVSPTDGHNTLTEADAKQMEILWDPFSFFLDDAESQSPSYTRIVRAIRRFEYAHYIYFAEFSHGVFHSALESLIYFGPQGNRAQIVERLPLLLPTLVTPAQAESIYKLHNDFKHEGQALQQVRTPDRSLVPSDGERLAAAQLLRKVVRELLLKALEDRQFADTLVDHTLMKQRFGVTTKKWGVL